MEKCAIFAERCRRRWVLLGLLLVFPGVLNSLALDAALPLGFSETVLLEALDQPVGMSQTPDGRLLIATRNGEIVSCKEGHLSKSLFAKLPLFTDHGEELLSLAMDPQFEVNRFLYVSVIEAVSDYRVVIYRLQADSIDSSHIDPSRSTRLFDLSVSSGERRSLGPISFGSDGQLYLGVGGSCCCIGQPPEDRVKSTWKQEGKILRFDRNGVVATNNPFFSISKEPVWKAVFATGLHRPVAIISDPQSSQVLAVDSDEGGWTEVQSLVSGQDYGWPNRELSADSRPFPPFYSSLGGGKSALGGGCFYRPLQPQFPSEYGGGAFVVDSLSGGIEFLGVHDGRPLAAFRGGDSTLGPVSVLCAQDGSLLFLTAGRLPANSSLGNSVVAPRLSGTLRQIKYQRFQTPFVAYQSTSADIPAESPTVLEVRLFDERGSTFQWRSNGVAIVGAQSHKISVVLSASDTLKQTYDCVISNALGSVVTESIQVGLAVNGAIGPSLMLEIPEEGSMIRPGDSLTFRASGIDQSTRVMGPGEFYWRIDFYHDGKVDEGFVQASSVPGGSVTIPIPTDVTSNAWYRVYLSAPSRSGVWSSIFRDIPIQKTDVTLMSRPQGIPIRWGTGSFQTPIHLQGLEGTTQSVEAPPSFVVGGKLLNFAGWSDGGNRTHATKLTGLTQELTAFYRSANEPIVWVDWEGTYTDGISEFRSQDTSWTVLAPVSLDGGFDDAQAWLAWNDKVPINPSSHYDLEVQSAKFYGGILVYRYNSKDVVAQAGVRSLKPPELGNELFCDAGPGTLCWNLLYWKTEDFANHGELSKTVVFDDATKFDLLGLSGGDGQPERNSGRLRLVLREGNSFYLSEWAVDPEAVVQDASLRAISASRWALYTPLPPFSLGFDDVHATWEFKQFTNVTAVGLFHSNDSASGPVEKLFGGFALRGFKVTGTASEYGEIWRQKFFGNTDGVESADGSDPDHDGWSNLFELAIGTDPTQSASAPKTSWTVVTDLGSSSLKESAVASPRFFSLELQLNIETPSGAGLTVEMSSDLSHWIPIGGLESEGATFGLSTVSNDDGKRIFRTRVPLNSPEISNRFFRLRPVR